MAQLEKQELMFSNQDLKHLIIPLIGEQFLVMALGIADTVMISSVGEAAISAISLVNMIANLVLQALSALCTGGAVVVAQYLGRRDLDSACKAAGQLMFLSAGIMSILTVLFILFRYPLLQITFGAIEADVMQGALVYWLITSFSFPFLAAYNAAVAVFRAMSNSKAALNISMLMNVINIAGNALLIYGCNMGVAGAAIATLFSRIVAAVLAVLLLRDERQPVFVRDYRKIRPDMRMIHNIFSIGVPSGVENSLFHLGKLVVQSLIAGLGTAALAANAVLHNISTIAFVPGTAIGLAMVTVIGQCVGAGNYKQAEYYVKKLTLLSMASMTALNIPILFMGGPFSALFNLSEEATVLVKHILPLLSLAHAVIWPIAFTFPNALRAAGDVKVTLFISFASMFLIRVGMSFVFVLVFQVGMAGIWYAMFLDWIVRTVCFLSRYRTGKWKTMHVIT